MNWETWGWIGAVLLVLFVYRKIKENVFYKDETEEEREQRYQEEEEEGFAIVKDIMWLVIIVVVFSLFFPIPSLLFFGSL